MEFIKNIINLYLKKFLQLEDLKWDLAEGFQIDHVKLNSKGINHHFQEKNIPIKINQGGLNSIKISYSPTNGIFRIYIKEIQAEIKPEVLSTVGKRIQQSIANIILDEDPVEFIDSYSYVRDFPISYLQQKNKKADSSIVDPSLIPEPPKRPIAAYKLDKRTQKNPPKFYPPLYESQYKNSIESKSFVYYSNIQPYSTPLYDQKIIQSNPIFSNIHNRQITNHYNL